MRDGDELLRLGGPKQRGLLALLLLNANQVVSTDRLLDELWEGIAPDESALHAHVSRLRKALRDPTELATRAPGYVLTLEVEQLDLLRFEALVARARDTLESGHAERAASDLRDALALWRGRPLADLESETMYRVAAERLDGAWLDAVELRVQADLSLGRHSALGAELGALVRRHPHRERLRGGLMLALYRSGRQTEALEVFTDGRRLLADEVGLEPGPGLRQLQQQILEQDPALDLPRSVAPRPLRRRAPGLVAAVAAVAGILVLAIGGENETPLPRPGAGGLFAFAAGSERVDRRADLGRTPADVAVGEGATWVVDADERTVARVDARTGSTDTFATGATPTDVATGADAVWVAEGGSIAGTQSGATLATHVVRIDPATRTVRARTELPRPMRAVSGPRDSTLAVEPGAVWALAPDGALARIDPRTSQVVAVIRGLQARAIAVGPEGVWLLTEDNTIARVDRDRNVIVQRERIPASAVASMALGDGSVWISAPGDGTVWRVQTGTRLTLRTIDAGRGVGALAFGADRLWAANPLAGSVVAIDPGRNAVDRTIAIEGAPRALAVETDTVSVVASAANEEAVTGPGVLPCGPVLSAGGDYDHLVVSDLPLQGQLSFSAQQMEQAIVFTLREHGFLAGDHRLGYQACDDSVARTGLFDEVKCAANARRYAEAEEVIAVIGWVNSPCASAGLPELSRAGLAVVSPLTSDPGLTRPDPEEVGDLYPGARNFARVFGSDEAPVRALARRATGPVAVIDDGDPAYGAKLADVFAAEARAAGLDVAVRRSFDPQASGFGGLARAVARSEPGAVFVGGFIDGGGARVVRALAAVLGEDVDFLLPEGFSPLDLLRRRAGPAAEGALVAFTGLLPESYPPAARRFVERFSVTQPGLAVAPSAVYAAQATEVALDAIARSDGTRASVREAMFATRLDDALIGEVAFDARGDLRNAPVTIRQIGVRAAAGPG